MLIAACMCPCPAQSFLFSQKEPGFGWLGTVYTCWHHGFAAVVMCIGIYTEKPWVWRHGLIIAIDIADWIRLVWAEFFPPGVLWVSALFAEGTDKKARNGLLVLMYAFHHGATLTFGYQCCLYFYDDTEAQYLGS